jgi:hypothetical protein
MVSLETIRANKHTQWEEACKCFMQKIVCFLQKELPDCKGISYMKTKREKTYYNFLEDFGFMKYGISKENYCYL